MADLDTENKRRFGTGTLPLPDGTVDDADRAQLVDVYPGLTYTVTDYESNRAWRPQSYNRRASTGRSIRR